jgi:hypothetical protein
MERALKNKFPRQRCHPLRSLVLQKKMALSKEEKLILLREISVLPDRLRGKITGGLNGYDLPRDDGSIRCRYDLLREIHQKVLPKLLRLIKRYPKNTFISIGVTSNLAERESKYDARIEFIKRRSIKPPIHREEEILFRSFNRFNSIMVEYLLQHHLSEGLWCESLKHRMNPQRVQIPISTEYSPNVATYVYAKFSTIPATHARVDEDQ